MEPISEALRDLLVRQELRGKTAGTVETRGKKTPGAADEGARRQVLPQAGGDTAEGERGRDMMLSKWRTIRERPLLRIMTGGKK